MARVRGDRCGACQLASSGACAPAVAPSQAACLGCEVVDLLAGMGPAATAPRPVVAPARSDVAVAATCMAIAAVLWGTSFHFIHVALGGWDPVSLTFVRCLIGGIVVGLVALIQSRRRPSRGAIERRAASMPARPAIASVAIAGACTAGALLGVALGQQTVSSSIAGIILGTVPVWTAGIIALRARLLHVPGVGSRALLVALVLGTLAGILPALGADAVATAVGATLLLLAAISHAGSMVAAPGGIAAFGPVRNSSFVMLVAAALLVVPFLLVGTHTVPDVRSTLALLEIGLLPTGLAYIAFFRAVAILGAARATVAIYLIPVVALVTGVGIGGESLTAMALAGAVCALSAVAITVLDASRAARIVAD